MNRKELIGNICNGLRDKNIRKPVSLKKNTFYITDDSGQSAEFTIKRKDKMVSYTAADISNILDEFAMVVENALKNGEEVFIRGFGTFTLKYHAPMRAKDPINHTWHEIPAWYAPKFIPSKQLKIAAKLCDVENDGRFEDGGDD